MLARALSTTAGRDSLATVTKSCTQAIVQTEMYRDSFKKIDKTFSNLHWRALEPIYKEVRECEIKLTHHLRVLKNLRKHSK